MRPGCRYLAVVKANAYGHGAVPVARTLEAVGADWFAVATLEEAAPLRCAGISLPILILGWTDPRMAGELARLDITQAVFSGEYGRSLAEQARRAERILPTLTEEEQEVFRRGRNAHTSRTGSEYHRATGLEALFGWLYLKGEQNRLRELFEQAVSDGMGG